MRSIRDIPLHHQTVFLRVDFNVPLSVDASNGAKQQITDDTRIKAALPTIEYIIQKGGKVVLASHLGRPKGKVVPELRMQPIAHRLHQLLGQSIHYVDDCIGTEAERVKSLLKPGEVLLLENLRFYAAEEENDLHFAEQLSQNIDVYITDAFGVLHRKHASTFALPSLIFDRGIGFLIQRELDALNKIIHEPEKPLVMVVGGMKISDKVDVIRNLAPMADAVLIGGGIGNTFLKSLHYDVGASRVESDSVSKQQEAVTYTDVAKEIWDRFESEESPLHMTHPDGSPLRKLVLPIDVIAAESLEEGAKTEVIEIGKDSTSVPVPEGWVFLDIGPKTQKLYADILQKAKTIFWNGPVGLFEQEAYAGGSKMLAETIAKSQGYAVLGGGDTETVVERFGLQGRFAHTSTGGGASLQYLAQQEMPGLLVLE